MVARRWAVPWRRLLLRARGQRLRGQMLRRRGGRTSLLRPSLGRSALLGIRLRHRRGRGGWERRHEQRHGGGQSAAMHLSLLRRGRLFPAPGALLPMAAGAEGEGGRASRARRALPRARAWDATSAGTGGPYIRAI
ncbi:hypothetical protein PVAP13_3NG128402 [Panicum virgatum]|uniref:Uncharacterized protein n=1 Tax=Panicum virgatum TaxID=38727 RepID=A0A8T0UCG7_PANVG|nr:hypothetical protein PVAP13_3NG128402 [Panicum virgatum]